VSISRDAILIVDDEVLGLEALEMALDQTYLVHKATSGLAALDILDQEEVAMIIADQRMPGMTGVELLSRANAEKPDVVRILLTGYSEMGAVVSSINDGHIYYYLTKPWDPFDLRTRVERALDHRRMSIENRRLTDELREANRKLTESAESLRLENRQLRSEVRERWKLEEFVGKSPPVRRALDRAMRVAEWDATTVLLTGESGTGKELVARLVHETSPRSDAPFVAVNCAEFPETLLESALFGYRKGAFTGATASRRGLFEEANGGTLFLDEVAEMTSSMQVKLLRALQERSIRPVGANEEVPIDVRLITATNRDLNADVEAGRFRRDLYFRIHVFPIELPPLRDRREDIPLLVDHLLDRIARKRRKKRCEIDPEALAVFALYPFPGNVRELENSLEHACVLAGAGGTIQVEHLEEHVVAHADGIGGPSGDASAADPGAKRGVRAEAHDDLDRAMIEQELERQGGNVTRTAAALALSRVGLQKKMRRLAITNRWAKGGVKS